MTDNANRPLMGVELPWFAGAYGHDMAPNERREGWPSDFDAFKAYGALVEARELGFEAVRVWLCEAGEGIVTRDGAVEGVHPALLDAVKAVEDGARLTGLRVAWTLLDGNADGADDRAFFRALVADPGPFATRVAAAVARALSADVTLAVELMHAPEALIGDGVTWEALAGFLRASAEAVRAARPGTLVTVGTQREHRAGLAGAGLDAIETDLNDRAGEGPRFGRCESVNEDAIGGGFDAVFVGPLEGLFVEAGGPGRSLTDEGRRVQALLAAR